MYPYKYPRRRRSLPAQKKGLQTAGKPTRGFEPQNPFITREIRGCGGSESIQATTIVRYQVTTSGGTKLEDIDDERLELAERPSAPT